jgi:hypothetical protein
VAAGGGKAAPDRGTKLEEPVSPLWAAGLEEAGGVASVFGRMLLTTPRSRDLKVRRRRAIGSDISGACPEASIIPRVYLTVLRYG